MAVRPRIIFVGGREFNRDLVAACQVGIRNLGVWNLERWLVLYVEDKLGLAKLGLAPVPASEGVFSRLEVDAVPELEELAQTLKVLLLEAVEEDEFGGALQDLDLKTLRSTAPLG